MNDSACNSGAFKSGIGRAGYGDRALLSSSAGVAGFTLVGALREDCAGGVRALHVAVTPEMAPVVTAAADEAARDDDRCWRAKVTARPSAEVLEGLRRNGGQVDVWVPDSSIWVQLATKAGVGIASQAGPVATSPVVLATPAVAEASAGPAGRRRGTCPPHWWELPPRRDRLARSRAVGAGHAALLGSGTPRAVVQPVASTGPA